VGQTSDVVIIGGGLGGIATVRFRATSSIADKVAGLPTWRRTKVSWMLHVGLSRESERR
jgi:hypothetical protein